MLGYMFENRNSTLKSVIKIADCLGRSLRENVQLFSIDSENNRSSFVTESGFVIDGNYALQKGRMVLENIQIQNSEIFSDNDHFNDFVSTKIKTFVSNIHESSYSDASISFDEILDLWETRLRFNDVKKRLEEKAQAFSNTQDIMETPEFQQFLEIAPQIISWLNKSREEISSISEIKNAVKLSNSVAKAFDLPKISMKQLQEDAKIEFKDGANQSIYDIICRQELVAKELKESRQNFDLVWANNSNINTLAALLYTGDEAKISAVLSEALCDVPYLALATKKQLTETFMKTLQLESTPFTDFSEKDIKAFASVIFEMKKPVKELLIKTINEKYGVNVQNLKEVASFRGLVEAQIVIFESLSRLAPKASVMKDVLGQVSRMLKEKSGVEAIDVNDILQVIFEKASYTSLCENYSIAEKLTLKEMVENDLSPEEIVSLIESQTERVSKKIKRLIEGKKFSKKENRTDEENGAAGNGGGNGGVEVPDVYAPSPKKKGKKEEDRPELPEEVQARLSGAEDFSQYGEATEDESDEKETTKSDSKKKISKEDFFSNLDALTNLLKGDEDNTQADNSE
jgi:hypothetical protein